MALIILAGMPATTVFAGTSLEMTAPAATTAFSPMVTPGRIIAPAPIHAPFWMCMCPGTSEPLSLGEIGCVSDSKQTLGAIKTLSSIVIPPRSRKTQSK